ncbi:hypothetical protein UC34_21090 [Pandoraea vervacti]|uniref:Uncharacterized protein n=1 Tax=Pandoraea vervacti TaxID=656178 RepID=A0ABN4FSN6_9BURK|nr:hypothetical protein UC34_21090 [Pandoraea vervacti]
MVSVYFDVSRCDDISESTEEGERGDDLECRMDEGTAVYSMVDASHDAVAIEWWDMDKEEDIALWNSVDDVEEEAWLW